MRLTRASIGLPTKAKLLLVRGASNLFSFIVSLDVCGILAELDVSQQYPPSRLPLLWFQTNELKVLCL